MLCNIKSHYPCKTRPHHYIFFLSEDGVIPAWKWNPASSCCSWKSHNWMSWWSSAHLWGLHTHTTAPPCVINTFTTPPQITPSEMVSIVYVQGKSLYDLRLKGRSHWQRYNHQRSPGLGVSLQVTVPPGLQFPTASWCGSHSLLSFFLHGQCSLFLM